MRGLIRCIKEKFWELFLNTVLHMYYEFNLLNCNWFRSHNFVNWNCSVNLWKKVICELCYSNFDTFEKYGTFRFQQRSYDSCKYICVCPIITYKSKNVFPETCESCSINIICRVIINSAASILYAGLLLGDEIFFFNCKNVCFCFFVNRSTFASKCENTGEVGCTIYLFIYLYLLML